MWFGSLENTLFHLSYHRGSSQKLLIIPNSKNSGINLIKQHPLMHGKPLKQNFCFSFKKQFRSEQFPSRIRDITKDYISYQQRQLMMQPWKINLLLLDKFAYSRLILWGPHVNSNQSKSHVVLRVQLYVSQGSNILLFGLLFQKVMVNFVFRGKIAMYLKTVN